MLMDSKEAEVKENISISEKLNTFRESEERWKRPVKLVTLQETALNLRKEPKSIGMGNTLSGWSIS